jgi:hypothetical protein
MLVLSDLLNVLIVRRELIKVRQEPANVHLVLQEHTPTNNKPLLVQLVLLEPILLILEVWFVALVFLELTVLQGQANVSTVKLVSTNLYLRRTLVSLPVLVSTLDQKQMKLFHVMLANLQL